MEKKRAKISLFKWIMLAISVLVCLSILYPLIILFIGSFAVEKFGKPTVYTFANYVRAFTDPRIMKSFLNTLLVCLGTSVFSTIFGVFLAWASSRADYPYRKTLEIFNLLPFFLSPLVMSVAWICLGAPRVGLINTFLQGLFQLEKPPLNVYGLWGIIWVMTIYYVSYMYLFTIGSLKKMDPALEEVARTCGSSLFITTRRITLPLNIPSISFGFIMVFIMSAGMFAVPATLGSPVHKEVLATQIFEVVHRYPGNYNLGAAISSVLLVIVLLGLFVQRKIILRRQYFTVTGKGYRPHLIDLGNWKYLVLILNLFYLFIVAVLPIVTLFLISLHKPWTGTLQFSRLTFANYAYIFREIPMAVRAIKNSLFIGTITASAIMFLSVIIAYLVYRLKPRGHQAIDFVSSLPIAIPGIVVAMGILIGYIKTPLYATLWIVVLAYICRFIPLGAKSVIPVLLSIHPEMDESSRICGASGWVTLRRIVIPLLWSGLMAGWLMLFIIFVKEINTSILLVSPGNEVTGFALLYIFEERLLSDSAAFAMIETGIILISVFCFRKILGTREMEL